MAPIQAAAQYCVGYTEYKIRRPNGKILTNKRFEKLEFVSFDGGKRNIKDLGMDSIIYYVFDGRIRNHRLNRKDGVSVIFGPCGQIGEMTLRYNGDFMKLIFGIGINNTNFRIQALPFKAGTFRLMSLECADSLPPPTVDNENHGVCVVPQTRWSKIAETEDNAEPTGLEIETGT